MADGIKKLRKALKKSARVDEGTVIKFQSGGKYTYAAIYVAGKWWLTGTGRWWGKNVFEYEEFVKDVLRAADWIEVATDWDSIKPKRFE